MIEVEFGGCNWLTLKGPGLGHHPSTSIARHGSRWEVELNAEGHHLNTASARTPVGVLERLDELLDDAGLGDVVVDREEIAHYMDRVVRFTERELA